MKANIKYFFERFNAVAGTGSQSGPATGAWRNFGWAMIGLFVIGGGVWAATARIDGAAIALGTVGVESSRKSVAHLEGGIIREIMVREGEKVARGQTLIRMDDTRAHATLELLQGRAWSLTAKRARLKAERYELDRVIFPAEIVAHETKAKVKQLMAGEREILQTRLRDLKRQDDILLQRITKQHQEIKGHNAERAAEQRRMGLLAEEKRMIDRLRKRNLVPKTHDLAVRRQIAETEGAVQGLAAKIAKAQDQIAEFEMERAQLRERHLKDVTQELQDVNEQLAEVLEKVRAARDILARTDVTAPADGIIVELRVHTPGGVVQAGEPLLDLVPQDDRHVVELKIDPRDIDVVYPGMPARVRLTAFNARTTPMIDGTVTQVSADRIVDPVTGAAYFSGRVIPMELPDLDAPDKSVQPALTPGMQAEVYLVTGKRTVLDYVLDPLIRTMDRAGREL